jgi:hypothetical protein
LSNIKLYAKVIYTPLSRGVVVGKEATVSITEHPYGDIGPSCWWDDVPLAGIRQWIEDLLTHFDLQLGYTVDVNEQRAKFTFATAQADLAKAGIPFAVYRFRRDKKTDDSTWAEFTECCKSFTPTPNA